MKQILTLASASALVFTFGVTTASATNSCAVGDTLEQQGFDTGDNAVVMREGGKGKSKGKGRLGGGKGKSKGEDNDCD